jgi:5-(carboxyamino)imidazole ribonucleotide synthase
MEFHPRANLVRRIVIPARVPPEVRNDARDIAVCAVETLQGVGLHAVELFWTEGGEILVNEIAPRPHNSGHITIEACETSQYEQHLRAICSIPLGSTRLRYPAASLNLLGAEGSGGRPILDNLSLLMGRERVHVHWYGKTEVRPFRKMGHATITGETVEEVVGVADDLEDCVWIGGTDERDRRSHHGQRLRPEGHE